jgi:hypothetical protein
MTAVIATRRAAAPFLQRLTHGLPVRVAPIQLVGSASASSLGMVATEALDPGDVLFVERAFAALPEPKSAIQSDDDDSFCVQCMAPQHRVALSSELRAHNVLTSSEQAQLIALAADELHVPRFELAPECHRCDDVVCTHCAEAHELAHRAAAPFQSDAMKELTQLHFQDADADAERALLAMRLFQQMFLAQTPAKRGAALPDSLVLGPRVENMCFDDDLVGDENGVRASLLQHTVGARAAHVNALLDGVFAAAGADRYRATFRRIASIVRLNAFRVAATTLDLKITQAAFDNRRKQWPPALDQVETYPRDSVNFVGLFSLACYFNHACVGNVSIVSTTVPAAAISNGAPSVRGDEFAFVALRPVEPGDELFFEYTSPEDHESFAARQAYLQSRYGFQCKCPRCVARL